MFKSKLFLTDQKFNFVKKTTLSKTKLTWVVDY